MLLHHIAAACLYFCFIFGNVHELGATIAFLHDLADVPGNLCKCLNSTKYQGSSAVVFVTCMTVWFVTRIYLLPLIILKITSMSYEEQYAQFQPFVALNAVFLSVMCVLHYYWFAMFCKILSRYIVTGEAKDEQNKVESTLDKTPRKANKIE